MATVTNYRGRPRPHPPVRGDDTGATFGTAQVVGYLTRCSADTVRRRGEAVACDVSTRVLLYDLAAEEARLAGVTRRYRSPLDNRILSI